MSHRELIATRWSGEAAGEARFDCPRCGGERPGTRTLLQPRLAVLGWSLMKLGRATEHVTCDECERSYPAAELASAASAPAGSSTILSHDETALLGIVAAMVFSDSAIRQSEKEGCREVVRRYTGRELPSAGVDDLLRGARRRWGDPVARLVRLRSLLREPVKRRIVEAAYHVCTADGELHREESHLIERIGEALELGPREVRRSLEHARGTPLRPVSEE